MTYILIVFGVTAVTTAVILVWSDLRWRLRRSTRPTVNPVWRVPRPPLPESTPCPHAYRGPSCRYTGPAQACGKKFSDCVARGNEINFGGRADNRSYARL